MINLSGINSASLIGRGLRSLLTLLPGSLILPVLQGPARGQRWIVGSSTHGCWLGSYEAEKQKVLARLLKGGDILYDLGANVGFYTVVGAKLVGKTGNIVAFEPLPRNLSLLSQHIEVNNLRNITIVDEAVSDICGLTRFTSASDSSMGTLSENGDLHVKTTTLDAFSKRQEFRPPSVLKIDVEGAEAKLLKGAAFVLDIHRPTILLATHGAQVHQDCCEILRQHRYTICGLHGQPPGETDELLAQPV